MLGVKLIKDRITDLPALWKMDEFGDHVAVGQTADPSWLIQYGVDSLVAEQAITPMSPPKGDPNFQWVGPSLVTQSSGSTLRARKSSPVVQSNEEEEGPLDGKRC